MIQQNKIPIPIAIPINVKNLTLNTKCYHMLSHSGYH